MIHLISRPKNTFPELQKPLFQSCNTCKADLMIDNLFDITVHEITYADSCGNPCPQENLTVECPNCHYLVSLNWSNKHRYFKVLKNCNIEPMWIEKYKSLTPLQKPIFKSISEMKLFKDAKDIDNAVLVISENLFTLARFVRTFNFPDVKLANGEYDPDFERFCVAYDNDDITSAKEAYDYIINTYNLKEVNS